MFQLLYLIPSKNDSKKDSISIPHDQICNSNRGYSYYRVVDRKLGMEESKVKQSMCGDSPEYIHRRWMEIEKNETCIMILGSVYKRFRWGIPNVGSVVCTIEEVQWSEGLTGLQIVGRCQWGWHLQCSTRSWIKSWEFGPLKWFLSWYFQHTTCCLSPTEAKTPLLCGVGPLCHHLCPSAMV